ncbi:hypothetical protein [Virgibacillus salinus]|uniref:Uncharacterized protein n=1 Tax=Virgibacillus salinus TaxID=553311 RepID=A0A1H0XNW4_9BACI|nr:hypothetical protein [Virgibacillus salinus]SDQ04592.1 hypothetical protein SAMN05216231_0072 [Virgibacillus salinus]
MANIRMENEKDLVVEADLSDLQTFVDESVNNFDIYREEIAVIYEKMPRFDYKYFCFYAYSTYRLLEAAMEFDTSEVGHIRVVAPDEFFYAFYGMIATLHTQALTDEKKELGA